MQKSSIAISRCRQILCLLALSLTAIDQSQVIAQSSTPARPSGFAAVDAIMEEAVAKGEIPGGVVLIGHDGKVIYRKAYGWRSIEPTREVMTADTVFDQVHRNDFVGNEARSGGTSSSQCASGHLLA